jgi:hypothetical protein
MRFRGRPASDSVLAVMIRHRIGHSDASHRYA